MRRGLALAAGLQWVNAVGMVALGWVTWSAPAPQAVDVPLPEPAVPAPVVAEPVVVPDPPSGLVLPIEVSDTTAGSSARRIDAYACAPDVDESGPEVWYPLLVERAGVLVAEIPERMDDGVDVDVHLLSRPEGAACVARGNARLEAPVTPGAWWLVVDTHVSDGVEKVGPYALSVRLVD